MEEKWEPVKQPLDDKIHESRKRSVAKALSWRIVASLTTMFIAWAVYGDIEPALTIGGVEFAVKIVVYYAHERLWQRAPLQ